jgi:hypothetical protein
MDDNYGKRNRKIVHKAGLPVYNNQENSDYTGQANGVEDVINVSHPCMTNNPFVGAGQNECYERNGCNKG